MDTRIPLDQFTNYPECATIESQGVSTRWMACMQAFEQARRSNFPPYVHHENAQRAEIGGRIGQSMLPWAIVSRGRV